MRRQNENLPKSNLSYLTACLPRQYGYAEKVAKILNTSHLKPIKGSEYNKNIILQIVNKNYLDPNVEPVIINLVEDFYGQPVEVVCPEFKRRFAFTQSNNQASSLVA